MCVWMQIRLTSSVAPTGIISKIRCTKAARSSQHYPIGYTALYICQPPIKTTHKPQTKAWPSPLLLPFSVSKHIEFQFPFQFVISEASACKGDGAAFEIQYREIIMRICWGQRNGFVDSKLRNRKPQKAFAVCTVWENALGISANLRVNNKYIKKCLPSQYLHSLPRVDRKVNFIC